MGVMRLLVLVVVAGCWRGTAATTTDEPAQPSFVVRLHGLAELSRTTAALESRLVAARSRIFALANERERRAIHDDLRGLADDVIQLTARARSSRERGDDRATLDRVDRSLVEAATTLAQLQRGLRYATTIEELQAYRAPQQIELSQRVDLTLLDDRMDVVMSPLLPATVRWRSHVRP